jgi:hypothetical protein
MRELRKNTKAISDVLFVVFVAILVVACVVIGFMGFLNINSLQNDKNTLQGNLNVLQSNYEKLQTDYQNSQAQLTSLLTELNSQNSTNPIVTPTPVIETEKLVIIGVDKAGTVFMQNSGNVDITIIEEIIKDSTGNTVSSFTNATTINAGYSKTMEITLPTANGEYTVTLGSAKGNSFVSPTFTVP